MSSETTDSDRLLARGVPITLADGETVRLRYSMRSLKWLEDEFGSIQAIQEALPDGEDTQDRPVFGPMSKVMYGGLLHLDLTYDEVLDLLSPRQINEYGEAVGKAFNEAFPQVNEGNVEGEPTTIGSPGTISTGSQSPQGAQTNSSGG